LIYEVWKDVPGYEHLRASSFGRVCSKFYCTEMPRGGVKVNYMAATHGYRKFSSKNYFCMQVTFRRKSYKVATLVALAFLGPRPQGLDVSHIDEDSSNNRPENLVYESRKANLNRPKIKQYHRQICRSKM